MIQLSYSAAGLLKQCKRRYYHKVHNTPYDADAKVDTLAFQFGHAFHRGCEITKHFTEVYQEMDLYQLAAHCCSEFFRESSSVEIESSVYAMLRSYRKLQEKTGLTCIACEYKIENEVCLGFIDAILADVSGRWYIVDLKTSGRVLPSLFPRLRRDIQLHLYSHFVPEICKAFGLNESDFGGVRYRVVQKPSIKKNAKETMDQYADRSNTTVWDYGFKPLAENIEAIWSNHVELQREASAIAASRDKPPCNFSACLDYNSACPFWSQCYSATYSECTEDVTTSETATLISDL